MTYEEFKQELSHELNLLPNKLRAAFIYEIKHNKTVHKTKKELYELKLHARDNNLELFIDSFMTWSYSTSIPNVHYIHPATFWAKLSNKCNHNKDLSFGDQAIILMRYVREHYKDVYEHWGKLEKNNGTLTKKDILKGSIANLRKIIDS